MVNSEGMEIEDKVVFNVAPTFLQPGIALPQELYFSKYINKESGFKYAKSKT